MARCYYLEYKSTGLFSGYWFCKLSKKEIKDNDPQIKFTCNASCGEEYKKCPVYKSKR